MSGLLFPKEVTNSPNICETDLPRRAAWIFAWCTSRSSIRNVSFVFMPYNVAYGVRLVNYLSANDRAHASAAPDDSVQRQVRAYSLSIALVLNYPSMQLVLRHPAWQCNPQ